MDHNIKDKQMRKFYKQNNNRPRKNKSKRKASQYRKQHDNDRISSDEIIPPGGVQIDRELLTKMESHHYIHVLSKYTERKLKWNDSRRLLKIILSFLTVPKQKFTKQHDEFHILYTNGTQESNLISESNIINRNLSKNISNDTMKNLTRYQQVRTNILHNLAIFGGCMEISALVVSFLYLQTHPHTTSITLDSMAKTCCLTHENTILIFCCYDKSMLFWNIETNQLLQKLQLSKLMNSCCLTKDDQFLLTGTNDGEILIWSVKNYKCVQIIKCPGIDAPITSMMISTSRTFIIFGTSTGKIYMIRRYPRTRQSQVNHHNNIKTSYLSQDGFYRIEHLGGHQSIITCCKIASNEKFMVTSAWDRQLRLWNVETKELLKTFRRHSNIIPQFCISNDNQYVISGAWDRQIIKWHIPTDTIAFQLQNCHRGFIQHCSLSNTNKFIISCANDCSIKLWCYRTGMLLRTIETTHTESIEFCTLTEDDRTLITIGLDEKIKFWQI